jgi:hypothetical protein
MRPTVAQSAGIASRGSDRILVELGCVIGTPLVVIRIRAGTTGLGHLLSYKASNTSCTHFIAAEIWSDSQAVRPIPTATNLSDSARLSRKGGLRDGIRSIGAWLASIGSMDTFTAMVRRPFPLHLFGHDVRLEVISPGNQAVFARILGLK